VKRPWGEDKNRPISTHQDRCGRASFKEEGEQEERKRRRMRIGKKGENREKSGEDRYSIGHEYLSIIYI
jgi:hypothetical protein